MPGDNHDAAAPLLAALHRFPDRRREIESLMGLNEGFCEMCEELALADSALANLSTVPVAERDARNEECRVWIARLTTEIAEALMESKVIPMRSHNKAK